VIGHDFASDFTAVGHRNGLALSGIAYDDVVHLYASVAMRGWFANTRFPLGREQLECSLSVRNIG
jgi:hypothetical protein